MLLVNYLSSMSTIVRRIKEYIDHKRITIAAFERSVGMANATFGKSLKSGGNLGSDKIEKILYTYPDLNIEWLMTGKGPMLNPQREPEAESIPYRIDLDDSSQMREQAFEFSDTEAEIIYLRNQLRTKDEIIADKNAMLADKEEIITLQRKLLQDAGQEREYAVTAIYPGKKNE